MKLVAKISGISKLSQDTESHLRKYANVFYVTPKSNQDLRDTLNTCDVFWFRLNHKLTKEIIENTRCKYILCAVTGLDHIDLTTCIEEHKIVVSLKNESEFLKEVRATAELTWALLLSVLRNVSLAQSSVLNGNWDRAPYIGYELYKKKLGILGMGRLGKIVAGYAQSFGMNVLYYDIEHEKISPDYMRCRNITELFEESDFLTIHVPYDSSTHHLIGNSILSKSKRGLCLVNTSRGGIIDEDALVNALETGIVGYYATDVLYGEPTILDNPIYKYSKVNNNVLITPHIGGNTYDSIEKTERFILNKFLSLIN